MKTGYKLINIIIISWFVNRDNNVGTIMKKIIFIYSTYKDDEIAISLVTQLSWTNNLLILSGAKNKEERHFYLNYLLKIIIQKENLKQNI